MILQALLVSKDDLAAETLIQVLAQLGVVVDRSSAADIAVARLSDEHFDQVIIDFDDPESASVVLDGCRRLACRPDRNPPITVALINDAAEIRSILGSGAHFVLTKPLDQEKAQNTLRAATALLKRERRQSLRVAIQTAVSIHIDGSAAIEGIMLDLSTGGMDVLAARPLPSAAMVRVSFELPDGVSVDGAAAVAWSTANGQSGLRFLEMEDKMHEDMSTWLASRSQDALPEEPDAISQCKLTDLSVGGCYVKTKSPFPESSAVDLCLRASGMEIHTEGLVRVMHPGYGMGIEFPARTAEQRASVAAFIDSLSAQPGTTPQLEASPRALIAEQIDLTHAIQGGDSEDALLELLRNGNSLNEDEFIAELERQRSPEHVHQ